MNNKFKHVYNRPPHKGVTFNSPSLVQPQYARDSDINVMIQRALAGDPSVFSRGGTLGVDATDSPEDFHEAMNTLARGNTAWEELPQALKHAYGNKEAFILALNTPVKPSVVDEEKKEADKSVTPNGVEVSTPKSAE